MANQDKWKVFTVNDAIIYIGSFGRYQKIVDIIIALVIFLISSQPFVMYFATLEPSWRCHSNHSICFGNEDKKAASTRCRMPHEQWYFTEQKSFSLITWFDISCNEQWILGTVSAAFFVGTAAGAIIIGRLSDGFGRKITLLPSVVFLSMISVLLVFMPGIYYVVVCRLFVGFFYGGIMIQLTVIISEIVGPSHRSVAIFIPFLFYPIGACVLSLKAYMLKDWRMICIVCTVPYFIIFLCSCYFIQESPVWLVEKGRSAEAKEIIRQMASHNKVNLPYEFTLTIDSKSDPAGITTLPQSTIQIIINILIQCLIWCSTTVAFHGLNFAANKLPGNLYRNFSLLQAIEIPFAMCTIPFCNKFGRKATTLLPIFLSGTLCFVLALFPDNENLDNIKVAVGLVGKALVSIPFHTMWLWSSELFPVQYRSQGVGMMGSLSRISAACAPMLAGRIGVSFQIMFTVFGVPALLASLAGLKLPETYLKEKSTSSSEEESFLDGND